MGFRCFTFLRKFPENKKKGHKKGRKEKRWQTMRFITLLIGWPFLKGETDREDSPVNRHLTDERSEKCAATRWKSITLLASLQKHLLKRERERVGRPLPPCLPSLPNTSAKEKHDWSLSSFCGRANKSYWTQTYPSWSIATNKRINYMSSTDGKEFGTDWRLLHTRCVGKSVDDWNQREA